MKKILLTAVLLQGLAPLARGAEAGEAGKPLFPVALDVKFPRAKQSFEEVKELILKNYYSPEIDEETLYWAAIAGMLRRISPPDYPDLGTLWTKEQYQKILDALKGQEVSLGVEGQFTSEDGSLSVTGVLPGSSADGSLFALDRILRFDGKSLKGRTLEDAKAAMDGVEGSTVTLTVNRDLQILDVTLKRTKFRDANLLVTPLAPDVALVEIKRFSAGISGELKKELAKLEADQVKSIVLDLRNDPGGVFAEGVRLCELFVPEKGVLLHTYTRGGKLQNYLSSNPRPFRFQVAILANRSTMSASELVAGTLRDAGAAFIVGSRTRGKGVFETTYPLKNEFKVKFITGAMFTPAGYAWQGKGIMPDFFIDQDEKTVVALARLPVKERVSKDAAILTALKLLGRKR